MDWIETKNIEEKMNESSTATKSDKNEDEETVVEWNDAQIRWTNNVRAPKDDDDDDEAPPDVFAPDPHQTFTLFQDIQLQGYTYESDQTWNSTGLTLWRASEYLGQYLIQQHGTNEHFVRNKRVLELGAGLGLCGIVVHRLLQAQTVYVTDGDSDVWKALVSNIQANHRVVTDDDDDDERTTISGHQLLWGHDYAQSFLQKMRRMEGHDREPQQDDDDDDDSTKLLFDVILAADVVYVPQVIAPLFETVHTLLEPTKGIFFLAFARRMVDVTVDDVLQQATEAGFVYKQCSSDADTEQGLYLYSFRRTEGESIGCRMQPFQSITKLN